MLPFPPFNMLMGARPLAPEANALFAAMTTPPTAARKVAIDAFVRGLKTAGIWSVLDELRVMAAADAQAARLNWITPGTNTLTATNSPAFVADRGYTGDGSTSFLSAGRVFSALTQFQLNAGSFGVWSRTDVDSTGREIGPQSSNALFVAGRTSGSLSGRINQASTVTAQVVADSIGFYGVVRRDSANEALFKNGVEFAGTAKASTAVPTGDVRYLLGNSSFSTRQVALGFVGGALTTAQLLAFYNLALAYMQAVGAA